MLENIRESSAGGVGVRLPRPRGRSTLGGVDEARKACALLIACAACHHVDAGPPNSTVEIGPYKLVPQSGFVYQSPDAGNGVVVLSDQPDVCAYYQASLCSMKWSGPPPGNNLFIVFSGGTGVQPVSTPAGLSEVPNYIYMGYGLTDFSSGISWHGIGP